MELWELLRVGGDGVPEFQTAEQTAGDVPQAAEQLLGGLPVLGGGHGMGQYAHGRTSFLSEKQYSTSAGNMVQ